MGLLRRWLKRKRTRETVIARPTQRPVPTAPAVEDTAPEALSGLVLFKFDACPYCARVQKELERLGLSIEQRDTRIDPGNREDLRRRTGRTQVPCLFINNQPLFESLDIIDWLRNNPQLGEP